MGKTAIAWTDWSQNFIKWFCTKTSPGCKNCYMFPMAKRWAANAADRPVWRANSIKDLRSIPTGAFVFVGDMYDQYHEQMPVEWIHRVHNLAAYERPDLQFQMLTKRIERVLHLAPYLAWPDNLWMGTTVENEDYTWRIDYLRQIPAATKFISFEPLLGDVGEVDLTGIDMAIVGAESGAGRRPFDKEWARNIRTQCRKYDTAFFYKQSSGNKPGTDPLLDGQMFQEFPRGMQPLKGRSKTDYRAKDQLARAGQVIEIVSPNAGRHGNMLCVINTGEYNGRRGPRGLGFNVAPEQLAAWIAGKPSTIPAPVLAVNSKPGVSTLGFYRPAREFAEIADWQEWEGQYHVELLTDYVLSNMPFQSLVELAIFSPNLLEQKIAIWCIGRSGEPNAAAILWKFIQHRDSDVRDIACTLLGHINPRWEAAARRTTGSGWGRKHYLSKPIKGYPPRPTQMRLF